ncbi:unnamed protein product [Polarella glacialis]|uniref:Uncharacterized protein n=1 Tax=Polarella glacialis TaxID=89957 RepID=A0A813JX04_POLGL|nr:unnamed protein product [Polarella glacialis]
MGPETSQLTDWLHYYWRLGAGKVFLYDIDGSGVHTVDKFPPGFVDRQPFFEGRGDRIWFDKLERENRWNWNLTNFYPRMGCVIHQLNHCLMRARGRAKYLLMVRALDKFFTVNFDHQITNPPIERFLEKIRGLPIAFRNLGTNQPFRNHIQLVQDAASQGKSLAAVPIDTFDYWEASRNAVEWSAFDYGLRDRFLHFAVTNQVYGGNGHVLWTRGTMPGVVPRDEFWMSHYLRAFDTTPEAQTKDPGKRWRFRFCDTLNPATDLADLAHIRQHSCADLGSDGGVAAEHHSATRRRGVVVSCF